MAHALALPQELVQLCQHTSNAMHHPPMTMPEMLEKKRGSSDNQHGTGGFCRQVARSEGFPRSSGRFGRAAPAPASGRAPGPPDLHTRSAAPPLASIWSICNNPKMVLPQGTLRPTQRRHEMILLGMMQREEGKKKVCKTEEYVRPCLCTVWIIGTWTCFSTGTCTT